MTVGDAGPKGLDEGIVFDGRTATDTNVVIQSISGGMVVAELNCLNEIAVANAGLLLRAAQSAVSRAIFNNPGVELTAESRGRVPLLADRFDLATTQSDTHAAMVFGFGLGSIEFAIPLERLATLAQAMLALSADGTKQ